MDIRTTEKSVQLKVEPVKTGADQSGSWGGLDKKSAELTLWVERYTICCLRTIGCVFF